MRFSAAARTCFRAGDREGRRGSEERRREVRAGWVECEIGRGGESEGLSVVGAAEGEGEGGETSVLQLSSHVDTALPSTESSSQPELDPCASSPQALDASQPGWVLVSSPSDPSSSLQLLAESSHVVEEEEASHADDDDDDSLLILELESPSFSLRRWRPGRLLGSQGSKWMENAI